MKKINYILIHKNDDKTKGFSKEFPKDTELVGMEKTPLLMPLYLMKNIIQRKRKPKAFIFRYLNDYKSFSKTLIRLISDVITVLLVKLLGIKLIWINHNVDKESIENHPLITRIRRKVIVKSSNKVVVMDKHLIDYASKTLNIDKRKVDFITFGKPAMNEEINVNNEIHTKIKKFIEDDKAERNSLIGLSIGNPNEKVLQPLLTNELIEKSQKVGINIKVILAGPMSEYMQKRNINEYKKLINNPNVLFIDGKVQINEKYIARYIDFYWRVYDDYSVPFTVYNAAYLSKPILTMEKGFLNEMVSKYNLGFVLKDEFANVENIFEELKTNRSSEYKEFIDEHNWGFAAMRLYNLSK